MKLMKFEFYFYFRPRSIKVYNSRELFNLLQTSARKIKFLIFFLLQILDFQLIHKYFKINALLFPIKKG